MAKLGKEHVDTREQFFIIQTPCPKQKNLQDFKILLVAALDHQWCAPKVFWWLQRVPK